MVMRATYVSGETERDWLFAHLCAYIHGDIVEKGGECDRGLEKRRSRRKRKRRRRNVYINKKKTFHQMVLKT